MTAAPLVSVVIATHERRALCAEAVASVAAQTWSEHELLVVDDASQDDTWAWLTSLDGPRLRALRVERNRGPAHARNTGLEAARGELVLFLDDDDWLPVDALERHVDALARHPQAIASAGTWRFWKDGAAVEVYPLTRRQRVRSVWSDVLFAWDMSTGAAMFRSDVVRAIGAWNEGLGYYAGEEIELWTRISREGPVVLSPETTLEYRLHGQGRPADFVQRLTEARRVAIAGLTGEERAHAERILRARAAFLDAKRSLAAGEARRALGALARVLKTAPELLRSPFARHQLTPYLRGAVRRSILP